ncbi:phosphopantetheine adenylyltransferase [Caballeronia sp.]|uniref:phosphopantetheine adenylyltransferase n=1 Tax=Caballeronia sp. TaxID=1931223 RepID=UPI003C3A87CD
MHKLITILLVVVGVIHVLPVVGAVGGARLAALYGMSFDEPDLAILMRHRAVLFGLLGVFIVYSAFHPEQQPLALVAGLVSAGSFLWIAWCVGGYNPAIARVVLVDVVAVACLIAAGGVLIYRDT